MEIKDFTKEVNLELRARVRKASGDQLRGKVLDFIKNFQTPNLIEEFTNSKCYWFAEILADRFLDLEIMYDRVEGHFLCVNPLNGDYFDITGLLTYSDEDKEHLVKWEDYEYEDSIHYNRILHQCVQFDYKDKEK